MLKALDFSPEYLICLTHIAILGLWFLCVLAIKLLVEDDQTFPVLRLFFTQTLLHVTLISFI